MATDYLPRQLPQQIVGRAPLATLLLLALLVGIALLLLVAHFFPLYLHELANMCLRPWHVMLHHLPVLGALIPLLLLGGTLLWGSWSFARQYSATHAFLHQLRAACVPAPANLYPLLAELRLAGRVCVLQDRAAHAFCYGLRRPRICVTSGLLLLLDPEEQRALLAHERHHLHRRDPLRKLLVDTLARALGFLPLVPLLHHAYQVKQEVAADRAAIRACGSRRPLASALVKLLQRGETLPLPPIAMSARGVLDARLTHLLEQPAPLPTATGRTVVFTVLFLVGILMASFAAHTVMPTMVPGVSECLTARGHP